MTAATTPALSFLWREALEPALADAALQRRPVLFDLFAPT